MSSYLNELIYCWYIENVCQIDSFNSRNASNSVDTNLSKGNHALITPLPDWPTVYDLGSKLLSKLFWTNFDFDFSVRPHICIYHGSVPDLAIIFHVKYINPILTVSW